ncbi:MAG: Yip1 family protein [Candidatus Pseudobacter hemicellulosilyticus]|uniref:Yip1 family protein n=1 Tax=Candidatus Pseudobacter hemicellulosilyticus TaxID=3121375 RepID=A0AAJ5WUS7_9BACT|nr:MAG: Yip1 family protein [Pseudobacter sp.]
MNLINRAKNILLTPKTEWVLVSGESATLSSLLTTYVLPLAVIPAVAAFLSTLFWTGRLFGFNYALFSAISTYVSAVIAFVVTSLLVDLLAPNFQSQKEIGGSSQLVAYSATAVWVASILGIVPGLGWLGSLAGFVYTVYLMYLGLTPVKKTPEDQRVVYLLIIFVVYVVLSMLLTWLIMGVVFAGILGVAATSLF